MYLTSTDGGLGEENSVTSLSDSSTDFGGTASSFGTPSRSSTSSRSSTPLCELTPSDLSQDMLGKPTQAVLEFPVKVVGSNKWSFYASWYDTYAWLEYSQQKDAAFCFYCRLFRNSGYSGEVTFARTGFRDWKHAAGKKGALANHASSHSHKACVLSSEQFKINLARHSTIGERLDSEKKRMISKNRHYVKSLAEVILLCAQQGLTLRGHIDNMDDPSKNPGNFKSLVSLVSKSMMML